ncbi:MAG: CotH kinase family protein [Lachnoclostridium sp.]|nr:CotH kinase family protein [Lachnospira sp.]MCM1248509.1 CotH kinase family protein [Lachnoclostridium sp.]MCM1535329.1 CotH kinase family protein [Clostridium sp.]
MAGSGKAEEIREDGRMKIRRGLCLLLFFVLAAAVLCRIWMERYLNDKGYANAGTDFHISPDSGFYAEDLWITLEIPDGAEVYYTDNCETPDREHGILFTEPLLIEADEEERVYVYRFQAFFRDGTKSEIETRTYFAGTHIRERYSTPVLHITGEPEGLFGYENGIFVGGKLLDECIRTNPGIHFGAGVDANFTQKGREWERGVYIQYFDEGGNEIISQNGGIRINGGMTRLKDQKSFKLYARREYDEKNKFVYPFWDSFVSVEEGSLAGKHKRLVLRNSGNDNGFAYIRSELACTLAQDAGFPDVKHSIPVCVYINGEYRGVYWMENDYDAGYFENRYGEHSGQFVVLEGSDKEKADSEEETEQLYVDEFNEKYEYFANLDLTKDENYRELQRFMDIENYLQYFAIENYVGNGDWPGNNVKAYRYVSPEGNYEEGTVFDGRYRHLLYDLDYGFGLLILGGTVGNTSETRTLALLKEEEKTPLFLALMEREDCRQYFINYTCDLQNGAMSPAHVAEMLDGMDAARSRELSYMLENMNGEESIWTWEELPERSYESVNDNCGKIKNFANERPQYVLADIVENLGGSYEDAYRLFVRCRDMRSTVQVNSMVLEEGEFEGVYFADIPVTVKSCMAQNELFDYWIVNGEIREEEELHLARADLVNQEIRVELVVHDTDDALLQISAVRAKGHNDFIELLNDSDMPVSTKGYFLSDDEDAYQYAIPAMTIQPGESRRFYGKDCTDGEGLGQIGMNFNLKKGETVTLTYGMRTIETLKIPELLEEGIYKKNIKTGRFTEIPQNGITEDWHET